MERKQTQSHRKLVLSKQTLRVLDAHRLAGVGGAAPIGTGTTGTGGSGGQTHCIYTCIGALCVK